MRPTADANQTPPQEHTTGDPAFSLARAKEESLTMLFALTDIENTLTRYAGLSKRPSFGELNRMMLVARDALERVRA